MRSSSYTFIHLVLLTIHPSWPTGFIQPNVHSLPSLSVTSQEYEEEEELRSRLGTGVNKVPVHRAS